MHLNKNKPALIMMIGLQGSGKSTLAQSLEIERNGVLSAPVVHSSDALRAELYGDETVQENNEELFNELHRRIREDLKNGKDVVYDATNVNKKQRIHFLKGLSYIDCHKEAALVMTPFETCIKNNQCRDRNVPDDIIKRTYMHWTPPSLEEGFDHISVAYHYGEKCAQDFNVYKLFNEIDVLDQNNKHHNLTLGAHCKQAAMYILNMYPDAHRLALATLLHDNGKVFTKTEINAKGESDGQSHYYQHHCVGAYDSLFYTEKLGLPIEDRLHIAQAIYYHMHPYMSWSQSEKALKRDMNLMSHDVFDDVQKLHQADKNAHMPELYIDNGILNDIISHYTNADSHNIEEAQHDRE